LRVLILFVFFLSLPLLFKSEFKLPSSHKEIRYDSKWDLGPPSEEILSILDQDFTYLAHGNQATVFASEDGKYVLKLFRYTRPIFPLLQRIKTWTALAMSKTPKCDLYTKIDKTFTAATIACSQGQKFTQSLFCHLNLTKNELPTITLKGKKTYRIPLDRYRFVIQKRATPFHTALLSNRDNPQKMEAMLDSLLTLWKERSELGIRNADPNLRPNFGFIGERAVEIDFGNYRMAAQTEKELIGYIHRLEKWLQRYAPEYVEYLHRNNPFCMIQKKDLVRN
jgi:hypothetical protein